MTDKAVEAEIERLRASPEAKAEWQRLIGDYGGTMSFERWCVVTASGQDTGVGMSLDGRPVGEKTHKTQANGAVN